MNLRLTALVAALAAPATSLALVAGGSAARVAYPPAANGRIAFSTDFGPDPQIFTVNADGSGETQVTQSTDGHATNPRFSPDGRRIVFQGDATGKWQLYEINADGSGRHQLFSDPDANDLQPALSPDGKRIAFARCPQDSHNCAITVANLDGSGMSQLTDLVWNSGNPDWSPDGTKLSFDSNQDGLLSAVWVMNADGSNQQRLTAPPLEADFARWSPNGKQIVFTDLCCLFGSNEWVMNANGSQQRMLTHFGEHHQGGNAAWSPDGTQIALTSDLAYTEPCENFCGDVYTMSADGRRLTRIVSDHPDVFSLDWGRKP